MANEIHGLILSGGPKKNEESKPPAAAAKGKPGKFKASFLMSTREITSFFEISLKTIAKWTKNGCPKESHGQYDLKKVFVWWLAHIHDGKMESADEGMNAARRKYWWSKARREEIKEKKDAGELMPRAEVHPEWAARMREVCNGLAALSFRLTGLISPFLRDQTDKITVQKLVDEEQWKLRDNYCRGGTFCPPESED